MSPPNPPQYVFQVSGAVTKHHLEVITKDLGTPQQQALLEEARTHLQDTSLEWHSENEIMTRIVKHPAFQGFRYKRHRGRVQGRGHHTHVHQDPAGYSWRTFIRFPADGESTCSYIEFYDSTRGLKAGKPKLTAGKIPIARLAIRPGEVRQ
jgi:hypothetical protein